MFWCLLKGFVSQHKQLFAIYAVFILIIPLQDVGLPHIIGRVIGTIRENSGTLLKNLGVIIMIMIFLQIGYTLYDFVDVRMYPALQDYIRTQLVSAMLDKQRTHHAELQMAGITSTLIKLPSAMYSVIEVIKNLLVPQLFVYLVSALYIAYHDYVLGIIAMLLVLIVYAGIALTVNKCEGISARRDQLFNAVQEDVDDLLRNSISVLNYNQEPQELVRLTKSHKVYAEISVQSLKCGLNARYLLSPLIFAFLVIFMLRCHSRLRAGTLATSAFISLFIIVLQTCSTLWRVVATVKDLVVRWGIIKLGLNLLDDYGPQEVPPSPRSLLHRETPEQCILYVDHVTFSYGPGRQQLSDVTLCIAPRQTTLIKGKIGSGKSTLLKLLLKYLVPTAGELYLRGTPYASLEPAQLRAQVGYIPQMPILFNRSVYENIVYGIHGPKASRAHVLDLLRRLDVLDIVERMPQGLDTQAGKMGSHLSGGQRQVVWIVRTILQDYKTIIADEPTSAMDSYTKTRVQRLLQEVMKGRTVVMVSHDEQLMRHADRIVEMSQGRIIRDQQRQH
jgi:ABC-type multidrug transport system fused ATPase/permease subunit